MHITLFFTSERTNRTKAGESSMDKIISLKEYTRLSNECNLLLKCYLIGPGNQNHQLVELNELQSSEGNAFILYGRKYSFFFKRRL